MFALEALWRVLVSIRLFRTNFRLRAGVVVKKCQSPMSSKCFSESLICNFYFWSLLTSQILLRSFASSLYKLVNLNFCCYVGHCFCPFTAEKTFSSIWAKVLGSSTVFCKKYSYLNEISLYPKTTSEFFSRVHKTDYITFFFQSVWSDWFDWFSIVHLALWLPLLCVKAVAQFKCWQKNQRYKSKRNEEQWLKFSLDFVERKFSRKKIWYAYPLAYQIFRKPEFSKDWSMPQLVLKCPRNIPSAEFFGLETNSAKSDSKHAVCSESDRSRFVSRSH